MKTMSKKGFEINSLLPIALVFVVTGLAVSFGLNILYDLKDDACTYGTNVAGTACLNSSGGTGSAVESTTFTGLNDATTAVAKFPAKMGVLATVVIAAILIGVLVRYLGGSSNR
jgi:hypothetical protein